MKHTKGPWFAINYAGYISLQSRDEYSDTDDLLNEDKCPDAEANGTLCSIAPEMFDAMQEFIDRVDRGEVRSKKTYEKFKTILNKSKL